MEEIQKQEEPKKLPWDKMEGEPDKSHFYFSCYLSAGTNRSLAKTAKGLKLNRSTITRLAKKWNWEERALMLDKLYHKLTRDDYLLEMQVDKENNLRLKSDIAEHAHNALIFISQFLRDFWATYENPQILKKLKFINSITRSITKLYKLIDLPFDDYVQKTRCERNLEISNLLSLDGDFSPIEDEIICTYKAVKDEKYQLRKPRDRHFYDDYGRIDTADAPWYKPKSNDPNYDSDNVGIQPVNDDDDVQDGLKNLKEKEKAEKKLVHNLQKVNAMIPSSKSNVSSEEKS